jgi:hypothetical protein
MTNKPTDAEIIKALECCIKAETWGDCEEMGCPASTKQGCQFYLRTDDDYENTIYIEILKDALDLINRLKVEIERLEQENHWFADIGKMYSEIKAETIKEFAERLKGKHRRIMDYDEAGFGASILIVEEKVIDKIVKEMVGEDNEQT